MIQRLYVNNYKSLIEFELRPGPLSVLVGRGGAGKTNVLDALKVIRRFVFRGRDVVALLPRETLTRWSDHGEQTFELAVRGDAGSFELTVVVEHSRATGARVVALERLVLDGRVLLEASRGDVKAYRGTDMVTSLSLNPTRSALEYVAHRHGGAIAWFHQRMTRLFVVQIQPQVMQDVAMAENRHPSATMFNFAMWWRHLAQEDPGHTQRVIEALRGTIERFDVLRLLQREGRDRHLTACFRDVAGNGSRTIDFGLSELSDGQRALIALYTLLHIESSAGVTLCVDDPESFLTTGELVGWLEALSSKSRSEPYQAILAASRPESMGCLDASCAIWLERGPASPTRHRALTENDAGASIAEIWDPSMKAPG